MPQSVFACAASLALAACAQAQPDTAEAAGTDGLPVVNSREDYLALDRHQKWRYAWATRPPVGYFVDLAGRYSSPADLEDASGDVSVWRLGGGGGLSFRLADDTDFVVRGGGEYSFYEFEDAAGLIPSAPAVAEPFDDVYDIDLSPILRVSPRTGWRWFVGAIVRSAGEPDADFDRTITAGGLASASYDVTDTLRLGLGVVLTSRLEGGVSVLPVPVIQWDLTADLSISTQERGIGLLYWFADDWNVGLTAGFLRREYRLSEDNPAVPGGSVTDRRIPLTVDLTYSPGPQMYLTARAGSELFGEMEFNDRNGNSVVETDLGSNLLLGLNFRVSF